MFLFHAPHPFPQRSAAPLSSDTVVAPRSPTGHIAAEMYARVQRRKQALGGRGHRPYLVPVSTLQGEELGSGEIGCRAGCLSALLCRSELPWETAEAADRLEPGEGGRGLHVTEEMWL